ncbi:Malate dehydrogenase [Tepidanaerobacter acetatoxydans Re1]|uniref:Malate dehydrogenase n=1 Tax=Tepidanaerobacter acetatoxydans (strain DSM 21804 / JCM 16047 / Re1) TaxID=1209989 RepID=F4LXL0_TEPAE|nr:Ldh family oxidoreductase [Tepidanaerobacter acetatoxydans]AEE91939.1 Malate dehydrogenase [Tepidanaerobacter acetatoxydans Re1]CCP26766.1 Malate dehydrogenase [Tepidanaerobacter acetatoxydans Re1]
MVEKRYNYESLKELSLMIFQKLGYSNEDSSCITDVLLTADLFGIESHGLQRLWLYQYGLDTGRINLNAKPRVIKETKLSAVIDADDAIGHPTSVKAMSMSMDKAKTFGVGIVVVKNSTHFGIAGYYSQMAAKEGLLGITMTNTEALVVPTYGKRAMLGTNPIAISMPAKPYPFLLDMSTSVVPRGKLEVHIKREQPIPLGWGVNEEGEVSDNPNEVNECISKKICGGILPLGGAGETFGGHKGYGLALAVEIFTAILSGGYTSDLVRKRQNVEKCCHAFIAIDYGIFGDKKYIEKYLSEFLQKLRDSEKAKGASRVYTHGEKEILNSVDRMKNGIIINEKTLKEIKDICKRYNVPLRKYLIPVQNDLYVDNR